MLVFKNVMSTLVALSLITNLNKNVIGSIISSIYSVYLNAYQYILWEGKGIHKKQQPEWEEINWFLYIKAFFS